MFPRLSVLFYCLSLYSLFLFSESELMRKGPIVCFSFARLSLFLLFIFTSFTIFISLLFIFSSSFICDGESRREKDLGMAVGRGGAGSTIFVLLLVCENYSMEEAGCKIRVFYVIVMNCLQYCCVSCVTL